MLTNDGSRWIRNVVLFYVHVPYTLHFGSGGKCMFYLGSVLDSTAPSHWALGPGPIGPIHLLGEIHLLSPVGAIHLLDPVGPRALLGPFKYSQTNQIFFHFESDYVISEKTIFKV